MIPISIGLLWDESHISGELLFAHDVHLLLQNGERKTIAQTAGKFSCKISRPYSTHTQWAIRLAECFTKENAARILDNLHAESPELKTEILEAGKDWNTLTAKVWWPIVHVESPQHAAEILPRLQQSASLNPFGFFTVRIGKCEPTQEFNLNLNGIEYHVSEFTATPLVDSAHFALNEVPIGRGFHWERKETLQYRGTLRIWQGLSRGLTAANLLDLETYLESAVGSEMRSDLPPAFSQAQAIAARSTVLATANRHHYSDGFDLCNDDHCQCYQGLQREANAVIAPIRASAGRILVALHGNAPTVAPHSRARSSSAEASVPGCPKSSSAEADTLVRPESETSAEANLQIRPESSSPTFTGGQGGVRIVDARYAKACGGVSERYEACWGEDGPDYFAIRPCGEFEVPDLSEEDEAAAFIKNPPRAWCNDMVYSYPNPWDKDPLFRWTFAYTRIQLGDLIHEKTGTPTGPIQALHVIKRGKSGRILILDIVGAVGTLRIHGELNIRRALSKSHLPSSYFLIEQTRDQIFLTGAGWGHGVGLCQLGAAAMAKAGLSVEKILDHYYPNTTLKILQSQDDNPLKAPCQVLK